jgi:hypothetical protein
MGDRLACRSGTWLADGVIVLVSVDHAATEGGTAMDPDNDPQIEYWQWHADSFQWVVGSLVSVLDSIPT